MVQRSGKLPFCCGAYISYSGIELREQYMHAEEDLNPLEQNSFLF
jgi:hypothetical protein